MVPKCALGKFLLAATFLDINFVKIVRKRGAQYDRSVSNGQKIIFHPLIFEYKNTTFGLFVTFYDVMDHI